MFTRCVFSVYYKMFISVVPTCGYNYVAVGDIASPELISGGG